MRAWRYMVLVAGIVGISGLFAPFIEYRAPDGSLTGASAYAIARGQPDVAHLMDKAQQLGLVSAEEAHRATRVIEQGVYAYRGAMIACFVPAALLALVGLIGFARRRMGRVAAVVAIVAGLGCVAVYVFFFDVDAPSEATTGQLGLGIYLLLAGGLLGVFGGFAALIAPDRGAA